MTLTIMTFSIITTSMKGLFVTLSIEDSLITLNINDDQNLRHSA